MVPRGFPPWSALVAQGIERRFPKPCVAGSNPAGRTIVMSQDIGDTPDLQLWVRVLSFSGGSFGCSGGLVVAVLGSRVSSRRSSPVMALTTRMLEVLDEQDDAGSGVGSADADVVQPAVVAQGDGAGFVDAVVADPVVGVGVSARAGQGFGHGVVEGGGGGPVRQGAVWSVVVVLVDEGVEQGLQLGDGGWAGRVGRAATSSWSAGIARPCRRWWGGWGGSSSGRRGRRRSSCSKPLRPPRPPARRTV